MYQNVAALMIKYVQCMLAILFFLSFSKPMRDALTYLAENIVTLKW